MKIDKDYIKERLDFLGDETCVLSRIIKRGKIQNAINYLKQLEQDLDHLNKLIEENPDAIN
jgi:hypothetical protein